MTERVQTEVFPLMLFAVSGMLIFPIANNLLLMFVALEVLSLPLYLMAGMARRRRLLSQEAALKYFLLGAFASAFFLYGLALLYGYANSVDLNAILTASQDSTKSDVLLYMGLALLLVGLLFKAGIAPFHNWTPDVYQGAPTPVTAFMASCTKVAAFGAILRVLYVGFNTSAWNWRPIIWAVAIASMLVGAVFGLTQTESSALLAYSSIAHAGFILVGLVALTADSISGVLFYLLTYGFTTIAAFGLLILVRDADGEASHLAQWSGLARKSPVVAIVMTLLLMSMAGIPLTAGFTGEVLRVPCGLPRRRPARGHRAAGIGGSRVLLPADRRDDVLRRAARERADHRDPRLVDHCRAHAGRARDGGARHIPAACHRPRRARLRHWSGERTANRIASDAYGRAVRPASRGPLGVAFADAELEKSVRGGLERIESALAEAVRTDDEFVAGPARYLVDAGGKRFRPLRQHAGSALRRPGPTGDRSSRGGRRADPPRHALSRRRHGRGCSPPRRASRPTRGGTTR